jgi:hypothetical protein
MALGGAYFKLRLAPRAPLGVELESLFPFHVYPVWSPTRYDQLLRVYIRFSLATAVARQVYGYQPVGAAPDYVEYLETWTPEEYLVQIGKEGSWQVATDSQTGAAMRGANPYIHPLTGEQLIPIVYIPRLRAGNFYGDPLPDDLRGLQNELNARLADYGDAVTMQSHAQPWGHDISRKRARPDGTIELTPGRVFDAGDTPPGGQTPGLNVLNYGNLTQGVAELNEKLEALLYDQAGIPPVMRGIDEGSQRSSLTLSMRALPTLSLIDDYRAAWRHGLRYLSNLFLILSCVQDLNDISEVHLDHQIQIRFAPILPKDIDQINQTISIQRGARVMSTRRALTLSPDVENLETELEELKLETVKTAQDRKVAQAALSETSAAEETEMR